MTEQKTTGKLLLILVITLLGSILLTSNIYAYSYDTILEKSFDVNPGEDLKVEAEGGDVTIETWSQNEVYVHISGNSKAQEEIEFEVVEKSYGVFIKAEKESSWFDLWGGIQYKIEVKVPEDFNANVATSGGDIKLDGMNGTADLITSGGDVETANTAGKFKLKTSGGDVNVNVHNGELDLSTSGGDVTVKKSIGDINAGTSGGDIKLEAADGKINAGTSGGDIRVRFAGNNEGIILTTTGGDISMMLDSNVSADLNLKTTGGDIDVDLQTSRVTKVSSSKFQGEINGGGPEIECKTTGGNITIKST